MGIKFTKKEQEIRRKAHEHIRNLPEKKDRDWIKRFKDYKGRNWSEQDLNKLISVFDKLKEVNDIINFF